MGHVSVLRPVTKALIAQGHRVIAALKDITKAATLSPDGQIPCLQGPVRLTPIAAPYELPSTFAHILHNAGFGRADELRPMVNAWRALYDLVRPDLILFQHSPTAILASYAHGIKGANIGTGFCCPPDRSPLPDWRPYLKNDAAQLRRDELHVREIMNQMLVEWGRAPLDKVTDLYTRLDEMILSTFSELDHFGARADSCYWGTWSEGHGRLIEWPSGHGPKIFGYLKPFPGLPALLDYLVRRRLPTVIYGPTIDRQFRDRYRCETLRFAMQPVELEYAGQQCDLAILNATHGTTASMLLAGKPVLQIPLYLEQQLSADNVARMGAGLSADCGRGSQIVNQLDVMLENHSYRAAAHRFAERYADFDRHQQMERLQNRVEEILRN